MSLHQFFLTEQVLADEGQELFALRLDSDDAKHARVLRLSPGEHIAVIDADSDYFECEIAAFDDSYPVVRICSHKTFQAPCANVVLVQGLAKGDKMEDVIRHATELGVSEFVPLACSRCVVKLDAKKAASRVKRWQAIAKSAAMQSGRTSIPEVRKVSTLPQLLAETDDLDCFAVCWEEAPQTADIESVVSRLLEGDANAIPTVYLIVGPEGGLSEREVQSVLESKPNASLVTLGPTILRTETAGVVAPALFLYEISRHADKERVS